MESKKRPDLIWRAFALAALKMTWPFYWLGPSVELTTAVLQKALLGTVEAPVDHEVVQ
jgi:hypothetical protein